MTYFTTSTKPSRCAGLAKSGPARRRSSGASAMSKPPRSMTPLTAAAEPVSQIATDPVRPEQRTEPTDPPPGGTHNASKAIRRLSSGAIAASSQATGQKRRSGRLSSANGTAEPSLPMDTTTDAKSLGVPYTSPSVNAATGQNNIVQTGSAVEATFDSHTAASTDAIAGTTGLPSTSSQPALYIDTLVDAGPNVQAYSFSAVPSKSSKDPQKAHATHAIQPTTEANTSSCADTPSHSGTEHRADPASDASLEPATGTETAAPRDIESAQPRVDHVSGNAFIAHVDPSTDATAAQGGSPPAGPDTELGLTTVNSNAVDATAQEPCADPAALLSSLPRSRTQQQQLMSPDGAAAGADEHANQVAELGNIPADQPPAYDRTSPPGSAGPAGSVIPIQNTADLAPDAAPSPGLAAVVSPAEAMVAVASSQSAGPVLDAPATSGPAVAPTAAPLLESAAVFADAATASDSAAAPAPAHKLYAATASDAAAAASNREDHGTVATLGAVAAAVMPATASAPPDNATTADPSAVSTSASAAPTPQQAPTPASAVVSAPSAPSKAAAIALKLPFSRGSTRIGLPSRPGLLGSGILGGSKPALGSTRIGPVLSKGLLQSAPTSRAASTERKSPGSASGAGRLLIY